MGFNTQTNPLASILGSTEQTAAPLFPAEEGPNPFLADLFTEAQPSGELAELMRLAQEAQTQQTESEDSDETTGD